MKLNFNVFGIEIQMELPGYTICITSERLPHEPHGIQAWDQAPFLIVARWKAWRLARMYALFEKRDQHIFIWPGTSPYDVEHPVVVRHLCIRKTVPFFSKK